MIMEEYITSGILESYIYGLLTEDENKEVQEMINKHPEIKKEVEAIEQSVYRLSTGTAPYLSALNYEKIKSKIGLSTKVRQLKPNRLLTYTGWAACIAFAIGTYYLFDKNQNIQSQVEIVSSDNDKLQNEIELITNKNQEYTDVLNFIRRKNVENVELGGQTVSPTSFAEVFWDKNSQKVIVDASGLPEPPAGKVYQVWSLKLNPLTPTSIGLLEDFVNNDTKLFEVNNVLDAEAFGITLEPAGGSKTPTMEQLYTLGTI